MDKLHNKTENLIKETYQKGDLERAFKSFLLLLIKKFQMDKERDVITTIKYLQKQYKNGSFEQASDKLIYLIEKKEYKNMEIYDS